MRAVLGWVEEHAAGATGTLFQTLASRPAGYPWGTKPGALPLPTEPDKLTGVLRGIDAIADALDDSAPEQAAALIAEANLLVQDKVVAHERDDEGHHER